MCEQVRTRAGSPHWTRLELFWRNAVFRNRYSSFVHKKIDAVSERAVRPRPPVWRISYQRVGNSWNEPGFRAVGLAIRNRRRDETANLLDQSRKAPWAGQSL